LPAGEGRRGRPAGTVPYRTVPYGTAGARPAPRGAAGTRPGMHPGAARAGAQRDRQRSRREVDVVLPDPGSKL